MVGFAWVEDWFHLVEGMVEGVWMQNIASLWEGPEEFHGYRIQTACLTLDKI